MAAIQRQAATLFLLALLAVAGAPALAQDAFDAELAAVRDAWAVANYQTPADQQEAVFEKLMVQSAALAAAYPKRPEARIWDGIVLGTYSSVTGGLGAIGPAKQARQQLEAALAIDPEALGGLADATLGRLYHKLPGWPIAFGSDEKARVHLEKAIQIDPAAIEANFFYGELLYDRGDYAKALTYLEKAQHAPPRPGREVADAGRQAEIRERIEKVEEELN